MRKTTLLKTVFLLCAFVAGSGSVWAEEYEKVTSAADLVAGSNYLIVNEDASKALGGISSTSTPYGLPVDVTISDNKITISSQTVAVLTLEASGGNWKFKSSLDNNYLHWSSGNSLVTDETGSAWTVSFSDEALTIAHATTATRLLQYNSGSPRFACYTSTQKPVALYKEVSGNNTVPVATIGNLTPNEIVEGANGTFTLPITYAEGATGTVTWESDDDDVLMVDDGEYLAISQGTANVTVTVTPTDETTFKAVSKTFIVTVTKAPHVAAFNEVFYESFDGCDGTGGNDGKWSGSIASASITDKVDNANAWTFSNANAASECIKCGSGSNAGYAEATLTLVAGTYTLNFKAAAWNGNNEKTTLSLSATNATIGESSVTLTKGAFVDFTTTLTVETSGTVTIKFSGSAGNNRFFLDEVELLITHVAATISAAEYATFHSDYALDFSETGITVYTATDGETSVRLNEITSGRIPANTPVVLYKESGGTVDVPVIASAEAIEGTNDLHVVGEGGLTGAENIFVLAMPSGKPVGFYLWDSSATLNEGKVYLQGTSGTRTYLPFNEATGISDMNRETITNNRYFDLQGRRVAQPTKGLYIVNGKKVIMK